ncbi:TPA_asm: CRISPR-associated DxTHG motif protein, partial [Listeria monocytogenes]|nr:CRISPR-associated DxTHG motif protein [Listeria monocytogenes]
MFYSQQTHSLNFFPFLV